MKQSYPLNGCVLEGPWEISLSWPRPLDRYLSKWNLLSSTVSVYCKEMQSLSQTLVNKFQYILIRLEQNGIYLLVGSKGQNISSGVRVRVTGKNSSCFLRDIYFSAHFLSEHFQVWIFFVSFLKSFFTELYRYVL